jgi:hypothetical protein
LRVETLKRYRKPCEPLEPLKKSHCKRSSMKKGPVRDGTKTDERHKS